MKLRRRELLTVLRPPEGRCLGAVFCTRSFDESFFESVLAAILPVHADPVFDRELFLREARGRLRQIPILVIANRTSYRGGHRLPYDLFLPNSRVSMHANLALILYEDHARFMIGSANLTDDGFTGRGELVTFKSLSYRADASLLEQLVAFIDGLGGGRGPRGRAWTDLKGQLRAVVRPSRPRARGGASAQLLTNRGAKNVLAQFLAAIPKGVRIESVGIARGFLPIDGSGRRDAVIRRINRWLSSRGARDVPVDVVLRWANEIDSEEETDERSAPPDDLTGHLLAQRVGDPGTETIRWVRVDHAGKKRLTCHDGIRKISIDRSALVPRVNGAQPSAWLVPDAEVSGPVEALTRLAARQDVRWWLYPETGIVDGASIRQPLHARALVVNTRRRGKPRAHVLIGGLSAEPERGSDEVVVEAGLHLAESRAVTFTDLLSGMVPAGDDLVLEDDVPPELSSHEGCPLESVTYDARSRVLKLIWPTGLHDIRALYRRRGADDVLVDGRPGIKMSFHDFVLDPTSSEIVVCRQNTYWNEPIEVHDITALPAGESDVHTFSELVLALGEAAGSARAAALELRGDEDEGVTVTGVNPRGAFEALGMLSQELKRAGVSLGAFVFALEGPLGMRRFVELLLSWSEDPTLMAGEAWVYAAELLRTLTVFDTGTTALGHAKRELLDAFIDRYRPTIAKLRPKEDWADIVETFYAQTTGLGDVTS